MLSLGYEVWTFFLGNLGLVSFYTKYQHIQKVGHIFTIYISLCFTKQLGQGQTNKNVL